MPHAVDQEVSMLLRPQYFQLQYSPEEQRTRTMEQAASKRKQDYRSAAFSWFSWEGNSRQSGKRNSPPAPESPISSNYKIKKTRNITTLDSPEVAMNTPSPYFLGDAVAVKASSSAQDSHQQPNSVLVASPLQQNDNSYSYYYNSNAEQHENTTTTTSGQIDCPHHHQQQ